MSEPLPHEFTVDDTYHITGRGLVAVGAARSDLPVGRPLPTEIRTPDGRVLLTRSTGNSSGSGPLPSSATP